MCDSNPTVISPESLLYKTPPFYPVSVSHYSWHVVDLQSNNTNNAYNQLYFRELFMFFGVTNIQIRSIKVLRKPLSITGIWFPIIGHAGWQSLNLSNQQVCFVVSLYKFMFTPLGSFVKSQCEQEPDAAPVVTPTDNTLGILLHHSKLRSWSWDQ